MSSAPTAADGRPAAVADDLVLPFRTVASNVMGRVVRMGPLLDAVLARHDYPEPVARVLAEALALTAMLGQALGAGGRLILQTRTDGPVGFLVVDYEAPGRLRGYANFDRERLTVAASETDTAALLGGGQLAMTIEPAGRRDRHQGIVALDGGDLAAAAHAYFRQSEQIPTFVRLSVGRHYAAGGKAGLGWRAGGLILQYLVSEAEADAARAATTEEDEEPGMIGEDAEPWQRVSILAATVEDHELLDPTLASERLLYRLFHEEGVRAGPSTALGEHCRCSRERISAFLGQFGADELADMREADGAITVTCEFCSSRYRFEQ